MQELEAHATMLAMITKASGGRCVWAAEDAREAAAEQARAAQPQRSSA